MSNEQINAAADRYLKIARWAQKRYTVQHRLVLKIGQRLSRYSQIERAAFDRYVNNKTATYGAR